jgi:hypothetical protein
VNAIDILGSLLGAGKSSGKSGGGAGDLLSEILGGSRAPAPQASPRGQRAPDSSISVDQLEDMLGVGREPASSRQAPSQPQMRPPQSRPPQTPEMPRSAPGSQNSQLPVDIFGQRQRQEPKVSLAVPKPSTLSQNDQAVLLIRAMINSAKVDGEISEEEQKNILSQVGDTSPETIQFLRAEFARPLNVSEFTESLPIGMEQKAYSISLMAIKLDTKEEADYLRQLAKSLRITAEECNQLHQQQNAPLLYQA